MFTVTKNIPVEQKNADGVIIGTSSAEGTLIYSITKVVLEGEEGIAFYKVTSDLDSEGATNYITFSYSGAEDVFLAAEVALKAAIGV